jgi:hypothetical protein
MSVKPGEEEAALPPADRPVEELYPFWAAAALDPAALGAEPAAEGADELDDEPAPMETT